MAGIPTASKVGTVFMPAGASAGRLEANERSCSSAALASVNRPLAASAMARPYRYPPVSPTSFGFGGGIARISSHRPKRTRAVYISATYQSAPGIAISMLSGTLLRESSAALIVSARRPSIAAA